MQHEERFEFFFTAFIAFTLLPSDKKMCVNIKEAVRCEPQRMIKRAIEWQILNRNIEECEFRLNQVQCMSLLMHILNQFVAVVAVFFFSIDFESTKYHNASAYKFVIPSATLPIEE